MVQWQEQDIAELLSEDLKMKDAMRKSTSQSPLPRWSHLSNSAAGRWNEPFPDDEMATKPFGGNSYLTPYFS